MAKKKSVKPKMSEFYKGYDIRWLRGVGEDHPDFHLVAEFDSKNREAK